MSPKASNFKNTWNSYQEEDIYSQNERLKREIEFAKQRIDEMKAWERELKQLKDQEKTALF